MEASDDGANVGDIFVSEILAEAWVGGLYSVAAGFTLFFFWLAIAAEYFGGAEAVALAGFGR